MRQISGIRKTGKKSEVKSVIMPRGKMMKLLP
jgi:hypothetical protein